MFQSIFISYFYQNAALHPLLQQDAAHDDMMMDFAVARREQQRLNDEFAERQRALHADEWKGLELAQQVSHEESDLMLASSLAQTEMRHMKELQRQRALLNAQVSERDRETAVELQRQESEELTRLKESLHRLAEQDLAFARTVQLEEQRLAEQEAMQTRREAEHKLRLVNWVSPTVTCSQDDSTSSTPSLLLSVCLPGLAHTDVTIETGNRNAESCEESRASVDIAAISKDRHKTFRYRVRLQADEALRIRPADICASYNKADSKLTVRIAGIKMMFEEADDKEEEGLLEKMKRMLSLD